MPVARLATDLPGWPDRTGFAPVRWRFRISWRTSHLPFLTDQHCLVALLLWFLHSDDFESKTNSTDRRTAVPPVEAVLHATALDTSPALERFDQPNETRVLHWSDRTSCEASFSSETYLRGGETSLL